MICKLRILAQWTAWYPPDWKAAKEVFQLPQGYDSVDMCHLCEAQDCETELSYVNCARDAPWATRRRTHEAYMRHLATLSNPCPLTQITGFHLTQIVFDGMHVDLLGLRLHALGSTFVHLCRENELVEAPAAGSWKDKLNSQLAGLSVRFKQFLRENKLHCTQRKFTTNKLRYYTLQSWPEMKIKAKNAAIVTKFLLDAHQQLEAPTELQRFRILLLWALDELYRLFASKCRWFSQEQLEHLEVVRETLLNVYNHLSSLSKEAGDSCWAMKPKFHAIDELCRWAEASHLNPGAVWAFSAEDLCGRIMKVAANVHPSSMSLRTSERWIVSFFSEARS